MSDDPAHHVEIEVRELTDEARNWGMLCHLAALLGFIPPFVGVVLGPLILWLIKGKEHPFIDACGRESLNFQISMLIYSAILSVTLCIGIGFVLLPALWALDAILVLVAAVKANGGVVYRYPASLRLIR
jgi:uncharacterized Tic20 family protein